MAAFRSVVKHSYIRAGRSAVGRAKAHVNYVRFRPGKDKEGQSREFFSGSKDEVAADEVKGAIDRQPKYGVVAHKFILSPGVAGTSDDVRDYTRAVMKDLSRLKGVELEWYGVVHENTANSHCHVIVMGKGLDGRFYKVSKADYGRMKEQGDRYLKERGLLKEERERENSKLKERSEKVGRFFEALRAGVKEFSRVMSEPEPDKGAGRGTERETFRDREEKNLGPAPTYEQLLARGARREAREKEKARREWQEYCRPIFVDCQKRTALEGTSKQYDRSSRLKDLRELEADFKDGVPWVREQLTEKDAERLTGWIKEKYKERKKVEREAQGIDRIDYGEGAVSRQSSREEIVELERMDRSGEVHLLDSERLALKQWKSARSKGQVGRSDDLSNEQSPADKKSAKTDRERLQDRLPKAYESDGKEARWKESEVRQEGEAARKENLKKQLNEQRKIEAQRETVDGAYTEKWGAWTSPLAAGPMGATSGGLRDLGPNEALRLLRIGISQKAAQKLQQKEIAKRGGVQRELEAEQSKLVDNIEAQSDGQEIVGSGYSEQATQDRQEADSFLKEIKERKKKEADRDQSRDPDRFDEWTGR